MASRAAVQKSDDGYVPFAVRFKAWWEGLDPDAMISKKPAEAEANPLAITIDHPEDEAPKIWPKTRIDFCRRLWEIGEKDEVVHPGGSDYTFWLMKPMGLTSEMTAVDMSAGLGGGTRKVARELNTYIDGYDPDGELAEFGHELSTKHRMDRRVPIKGYDPDDFQLPENRFGGVLVRERLFRIQDKEHFLKMLYCALKPRGHMVVTDFVVKNDRDANSPEIMAWLSRESSSAELWSSTDYRQALISYGMDLPIAEDETDEYRAMLLQGWSRFVAGLSKPDLTRDLVNDMMREAEYWLMLIRALESGKLRYYRYHAIRGGESIR